MLRIVRFLYDDQATTAVEYAVLLALILMGVITGISAVGAGSGGMWGNVKTELHNHGFG